MLLTNEDRIDIILFAENCTPRHLTSIFIETHRTHINHDIVAKFIKKFKRICSVADACYSGRSKTATAERTSTQVLAEIARYPVVKIG